MLAWSQPRAITARGRVVGCRQIAPLPVPGTRAPQSPPGGPSVALGREALTAAAAARRRLGALLTW